MDMGHGEVDRRHGLRVSVEAPLLIRTSAGKTPTLFQQERTKNLSLAGAYFETARGEEFAVNVPVTISILVPAAETRHFPFTRIAGCGHVARMRELQPEKEFSPSQKSPGFSPRDECTLFSAREGASAFRPGGSTQKRFGIAVEFNDDITALAARPQPG